MARNLPDLPEVSSMAKKGKQKLDRTDAQAPTGPREAEAATCEAEAPGLRAGTAASAR